MLGPVKRGVTDTPRREESCEARVRHHPLACARYFTPYTGGHILGTHIVPVLLHANPNATCHQHHCLQQVVAD